MHSGVASILLAVACVSALNESEAAATNENHRAFPVIYCTDLFHPHEDPDDHFDLATLYAIPELDIKGIVLDQGARQLQSPGRIPVSQLNQLTGRNVPAVPGLAKALKNPTDPARDQPAQFQQGVEFVLRTLRASPKPVRIAAVGSMRDIVAAFNREPELFRTNVAMILAFIGEASDPGFREYNVALDPHAYVGLMRSGLPVYWVPCFDGGAWKNQGHASFCRVKQQDLLRDAAPPLLQYFIYALEREKADPLPFLRDPVDPVRQARLFAGTRNLWCTTIFGLMAEREVIFAGTNPVLVPPRSNAAASPLPNALFGFSPVELTVSEAGVVHYGKSPDSKRIMRFEIHDPARFADGMTRVTAALLETLGHGPDANR